MGEIRFFWPSANPAVFWYGRPKIVSRGVCDLPCTFRGPALPRFTSTSLHLKHEVLCRDSPQPHSIPNTKCVPTAGDSWSHTSSLASPKEEDLCRRSPWQWKKSLQKRWAHALSALRQVRENLTASRRERRPFNAGSVWVRIICCLKLVVLMCLRCCRLRYQNPQRRASKRRIP